jgi:hypothetical protein
MLLGRKKANKQTQNFCQQLTISHVQTGYVLRSNMTLIHYPFVGEWTSAIVRANSNRMCLTLNVSTFGVTDTTQTADPGDQRINVYVDLFILDNNIKSPASPTTVFALNFTGPFTVKLMTELFLGELWVASSVAQVVLYVTANTIVGNLTVESGNCARQAAR